MAACTYGIALSIITYKSHAKCYKAVITDYPLLILQVSLTTDCSNKWPALVMTSFVFEFSRWSVPRVSIVAGSQTLHQN